MSLINVTNGAKVTINNIGLNKDSKFVTDVESSLNIIDSSINNVKLNIAEGNVIFNEDEFINSYLTVLANSNIANSTIFNTAIAIADGKSKIANNTINDCDIAITQTGGELDIISNLITDNNIGINITGGKTNIEYNIIFNNNFGLVFIGDNVTNNNNWWGKTLLDTGYGEKLSDNPADIYRLENNEAIEFTQLVLKLTSENNVMETGKEYTINVNLNTDGYLKTFNIPFTSEDVKITDYTSIENGIGLVTILTPNTVKDSILINTLNKSYTLDVQIVDLNQIIADLTNQLNEAKDNITKLEGNLSESNDKVNNLTIKLENAEANVTQLSKDLAAAKENVNNLTIKLENAEANVTQLSKDLAVAKENVNNLTAQLTEAQKQIQTLSADLISTTISANNLAIKALDNGNIQVTLKDANNNLLTNKSVQVIINGVTYNGTTNNNGIASISVKYASAGTYNAVVSFLGDDTYKGSIGTSKVVVSKKATTLTAKKATLKVKKAKKIKVTLKSNGKTVAGKTITIKINKKTFKAKTNSKGIATIKLKVAKKGKFKAVVKFAGDSTYNAVTKKIKLTVKK